MIKSQLLNNLIIIIIDIIAYGILKRLWEKTDLKKSDFLSKRFSKKEVPI